MSATEQAVLPKARMRVLQKARAKGRIFIAGGFSDAPPTRAWNHPEFDTRLQIEKAIAAGHLRPAEAFNTYVLTEAGRQELNRQPVEKPVRKRRKPGEAGHV